MKLLTSKILLRPSVSAQRGAIFIPETSRASSACIVELAGPDVKPPIKEGSQVLCRVGIGDRNVDLVEGCFLTEASKCYAIFYKKQIFPLGRTVLVRRFIGDYKQGGILIPANRNYQSLEVEIIRLGLSRKPCKVNGYAPGDIVRLKEWSQDMIETQLEDGSYGLIVTENDLLYKYENATDWKMARR